MSKKQKKYYLTENEIVRISRLFGCFEDAVKEIIRARNVLLQDDPPTLAEMRFAEEAFNSKSYPSSIDGIVFQEPTHD